MNVLTDKFPTKIRVGEEICEVDADFRNCIRIIEAFESEELTTGDKYEVLVRRLYRQVPKDLLVAIKKGIQFLDCGDEPDEGTRTPKRVYSFQKDGRFIYSAVRQTHGLDLEEVEFLHWWKFVFLFSDVKSDTTFANMVSLRDKRNRGKLSKEERVIFNRSREILDLDYDNQPTEEEREFMRRLKGG